VATRRGVGLQNREQRTDNAGSCGRARILGMAGLPFDGFFDALDRHHTIILAAAIRHTPYALPFPRFTPTSPGDDYSHQ